MIAVEDGVSEGFVLEELLRRELEQRGSIPARDEGARRAMLIAEQIWGAIPAEERKEREKLAWELRQELREIQDEIAALPVLDPRSAEEVMRDLYDEDGLPR